MKKETYSWLMGTWMLGAAMMMACMGLPKPQGETTKDDSTAVKREIITTKDKQPVSTALDVKSFGFLGPVKAGFYQAFAWTFGASLTKKYDPEGKDRLTERVVLMVESGQL